jgi:hypothetical protein
VFSTAKSENLNLIRTKQAAALDMMNMIEARPPGPAVRPEILAQSSTPLIELKPPPTCHLLAPQKVLQVASILQAAFQYAAENDFDTSAALKAMYVRPTTTRMVANSRGFSVTVHQKSS